MKIAMHTEALGDYISGGILWIVEIMNRLYARGHEVCVFVDKPPFRSGWIHATFPVLPSESQEYEKFDGILVCPFSPTAETVANHPNAIEKMYAVHTMEDKFQYNGPEWAQRAYDSYGLPLKCFATSEYVRIMLEMRHDRRVIGTLVPPGFDPSVFDYGDWSDVWYRSWDRDKGPLQIGVFGRAHEIRGTKYAFEAIKMAQRAGIKCEPVIIPDGIRTREQVADFYRRMHLFVDPSRLAGCPTPPKEAMACGAVPIVTPYGSTDFVMDKQNGYIVPVDNRDAIYMAIRDYAEISLRRKREMHKAAYNTVRYTYTWNNIADRFVAAVEEADRRGDELLEPRTW